MYDILIRNGRVVDGTGSPWFLGDVAVSGETIEAVGHLPGATAKQVVNAENQIVSPGFIDPHTHSDFPLFEDPAPDFKLQQGITTEIVGNCGISVAPLDDGTRRELEKYVAFMQTDGNWDWHRQSWPCPGSKELSHAHQNTNNSHGWDSGTDRLW